MKNSLIKNIGLQNYESTWKLQQELFQAALDAKKNGLKVVNQVLFVEHPPVFTLGKSGNDSNVLASEESLGAKVFRIERGGDVTFHGPGQLVVYPIIDLEDFNMSLRSYVGNMEQVIINTLEKLGLKGTRSSGASGVWLDVGTNKERKICALGVKASRHVTMHGLAFNINTDLTWFQKINPCGFLDKGVTSLAKELGEEQDFKKVSSIVGIEFEKIFN
jgi:lipoyl(octanoyl) transferase